TSARPAPGRVVRQRSHALDDVPVPAERQPPEDISVVADKRLAVEHDGEEVDRQIAVGRRVRRAGAAEGQVALARAPLPFKLFSGRSDFSGRSHHHLRSSSVRHRVGYRAHGRIGSSWPVAPLRYIPGKNDQGSRGRCGAQETYEEGRPDIRYRPVIILLKR